MARQQKLQTRTRGQRIQKQTRIEGHFYPGMTESPTCVDLLYKYFTETDASSDSFEIEIAEKTRRLLIGRQEALLEVAVDRLVKQQDGVDEALIYVVSNVEFEHKLPLLVNNLLHRGANTSAVDRYGRTSLHHAVMRNNRVIVTKLLDNDASPNIRDKDLELPLRITIDRRNDEMSALLLAYMPNDFVRGLFLGDDNEAEFSLYQLLRSETSMQQTILSVLDCMLEPRGCYDSLRVYYDILESDANGRIPTHPLFDSSTKSPIQIIAKQGNKNIVYHDTVRLLIRRKWKKYAKRKFEYNTFVYMFALFCITFSAIVAVMEKDPAIYTGPLQVARAVTEVFSLIIIFYTLCVEVKQFVRHRLEYFHDRFNYLDLTSSVLLLTVPALRFTHNNAQWYVFAFGYLFWTIRIFKYAAVFRQTGAYVQILSRAVEHDFVQFGALFLVILLAFSVPFYLSLRGDGDLDKHNETSTFWGILFVGVRSLTEAAPVVEYTGPDGYATLSVIFMLVFLIICIVVLLNILIAQLTDTYQKVQEDAQRGLEVNRAWIVAKVELNSMLCFTDLRLKHYIPHEDINDIKDVLEKWESPPLNEMNKCIRDIWDSLENHKLNLLTVQHRMARQENALQDMRDQLRCLVELHTLTIANNKDATNNTSTRKTPSFYRSETEEDYSDRPTNNNTVTPEDIDIDVSNNNGSKNNNGKSSSDSRSGSNMNNIDINQTNVGSNNADNSNSDISETTL